MAGETIGGTGVDYTRAGAVRAHGGLVAEKYIGAEAAELMRGVFDEMLNMPRISSASLPKTPVLGGSAADFIAAFASTPVVTNPGEKDNFLS